MAELKRTLGLGACVFYGVGSILGAGIYTLIGKTAGVAGNFAWLAYLIASFCALLTAFSYAELSTAFPKAGGEYVYAKEAFGKKAGMTLGIIITLNGIITGAAVAVGFAGYFSDLTGIELVFVPLLIVGFIFLVNAAGIQHSSVVNTIFTLIEVGGLLLVICCSVPEFGKVDLLELPPDGTSGIFMAAALAFFAYVGFEEIVKLAEETRKPEKVIPRALFLTSIIVIIVYTLVSISAVSVVPFDELGSSESPLADVVGTQIGQTGIVIISVVALFSTSNTILSNMLGSSRVLLNMSKESEKLSFFSKISGKRKTPIAALILILVIMGGFSLIRDIETIARLATVFIFLTFIAVNLCVIVLRIHKKDVKRPYKVPFSINNIPVISVLGVLLTTVLLGFTIYSFITGQAGE
jgi:APA family basic amino acid/polyamine antiporter